MAAELDERLFRLFLGKMVQYCIAAGCSNTRSDGVSLFKFPSDPVLREKWTREVKRMCDRWSGPTKHSVLCEKHFTAESFEPDSAIASSMGLAKRKRLRPNAIPTIFERRRPSTSEVGTSLAAVAFICSLEKELLKLQPQERVTAVAQE